MTSIPLPTKRLTSSSTSLFKPNTCTLDPSDAAAGLMNTDLADYLAADGAFANSNNGADAVDDVCGRFIDPFDIFHT